MTHLLVFFNWKEKSSLCILKTRDNPRSQQITSSGSKLFDWNKTVWLEWVKAKTEPEHPPIMVGDEAAHQQNQSHREADSSGMAARLYSVATKKLSSIS